MLALLAVVLAQAVAGKPDPIQPRWIRKPSGADLARYYPQQAVISQTPGRVVLSCRVDAEGTLVDCNTEDENPVGMGFGDAALKMAPMFKMRPTTLDGKPVAGGTVLIPVAFALPERQDGVSAALRCYGVTAARSEADPTNDDNWYATRFWALQSMAFAGAGHIPPSHVERDLQASRLGAAADTDRLHAREAGEACDRVMHAATKK